MNKKNDFLKLQASGNDFILIDFRKDKKTTAYYSQFAKKYCDRKFGIGADGLLAIEPSKKYDFFMRIFNSDGSEAKMCGNGARCTALWASKALETKNISFETKAGQIRALVSGNDREAQIRLNMSNPKDLKFNIPIKILNQQLKVQYINTGVPHTIVMAEKVEDIALKDLGAKIRFHEQFKPQGTNVDFVEFREDNFIKIRTYERGVEDETLACGTGSVASAIISDFYLNNFTLEGKREMLVEVQSGEILKVSFKVKDKSIEDVWLEGKSYLVYYGCL